MDKIIKLLEENNAMLKAILAKLCAYEANDDMRQFSINVAANLFVEMLEENKGLKEQIKNKFKL